MKRDGLVAVVAVVVILFALRSLAMENSEGSKKYLLDPIKYNYSYNLDLAESLGEGSLGDRYEYCKECCAQGRFVSTECCRRCGSCSGVSYDDEGHNECNDL